MATRSCNTHFRRELLPSPRFFYEKELGRLTRPNRLGWASARSCPFHKSKSNTSTSLRVNLLNGRFKCMSCNLAGDIVAFVQQRDGLSFKYACIKLDCWDEAPSRDTVRRIEAQERECERKRQIEEQRAAEVHRLRMSMRSQIHTAARLIREAGERLDELNAGAIPLTPSEEDTCWAVMSLAHDDLRDCEHEYLKASGLLEVGNG